MKLNKGSFRYVGILAAAAAISVAGILWGCSNPLLAAANAQRAIASSPKIGVSVNGAAVPVKGAVGVGEILVGTTIQATIAVSNTGVTSLSIDPAKITLTMGSGTPANCFTLGASSFSSSIEPGASSSFTVSFTPPSAASFSATLAIASNDVTAGTYSCTLSGTGLGMPNAPTGLGASSDDGKSTVVWSAVAGAASYNLYYSTSSGADKSGTKVEGVSSPYTLTGLTNGKTYYIVLTSLSSGIESSASTQVQTTPAATPTGAPSEVMAASGPMSATISWKPVSGADSYNIYYQTGSAPTALIHLGAVTGAVSPCTVKRLNPNATYYFVVTAYNGSESASNPSVVMPDQTPYAPTISASVLGTSSIRVTGDVNNYAMGYTLYYSTSSSVTTSNYTGKMTNAGSSSTSFDITGLSPGTTYYFIMTASALNGAYVSAASSQASAITVPTAPAVAANSVMVDNGTVYLPWSSTNGSGVTYTVMRSADGGSTWTTAASGVTTNYYLDSGLVNWKTYSYEVKAVAADSSSSSAYSNTISAMPVHEAIYILDYNNANMIHTSLATPGASAAAGATGSWSLGSLTPVGVGAHPSMAAQDASMKYIYESNANTQWAGVAGYPINASTGALMPIVADVDTSIAMEGIGIASPTGASGKQFLYATHQGDTGSTGLVSYEINNSTGALTLLGSVPTDANPRDLVVSPDGAFVFVSNFNSKTVCAYKISPSNGFPTWVVTRATGANPYKMAISPSGKNLYVANFGGMSVSQYSIDTSTGALSDHLALGADIAVGKNPTSVAIDPSGSFVYVANALEVGGTIDIFAVNSVTGALTKGTYVTCDNYCNQVVVDHSGQYLLAACANSNTVEIFAIDKATGGLTYVNKWLITGGTPRVTSVFIGKLP